MTEDYPDLLDVPSPHSAPSMPASGVAHFPPSAGGPGLTDWSRNPFAPGVLSSQGSNGNIIGTVGSTYHFGERRNGSPHVSAIPHSTSGSNDNDTNSRTTTYVPGDGISNLNDTYQPAALGQQVSNGFVASGRKISADSTYASVTSACFDGSNGDPHVPVIDNQPTQSHVGTRIVRSNSPAYDYKHNNAERVATAGPFSNENLAAFQVELRNSEGGRVNNASGFDEGWHYVVPPATARQTRVEDVRSTDLGETGDAANDHSLGGVNGCAKHEPDASVLVGNTNDTTLNDGCTGRVHVGPSSYMLDVESKAHALDLDNMRLEKLYWEQKCRDAQSEITRIKERNDDLKCKLAG
ncbi:hypothetical protein I302_102871 [Kwoniella bestiolae CBS 10118]|uniref:Uncharacterized protein n=1 Tax=Kwoniella bestiolae CBS 10118 TaxID=1296100 RepID=A0A1B9GGF0_9TREE|nr:hypothetical protein I302_01566 [Kwoniella bestiolae CBS 10118]OCF30048.1 hypothetical protein I302_01566 [Kwoniella bestiolae CBS 10118]